MLLLLLLLQPFDNSPPIQRGRGEETRAKEEEGGGRHISKDAPMLASAHGKCKRLIITLAVSQLLLFVCIPGTSVFDLALLYIVHRVSIAKQLGETCLCRRCRRRQMCTRKWKGERDLYILFLLGRREKKATSSFAVSRPKPPVQRCVGVCGVWKGVGWGYES